MKGLKTVMFVEDEPDIREIARLALGEVGGLAVATCGSGAEALERVAQVDPDLILLDVMMPDMDGPATLQALRKRDGTGDIPVIYISAKVQPGEISTYLEQGVIGVIAKPFDPMSLADELRKLLAGSTS